MIGCQALPWPLIALVDTKLIANITKTLGWQQEMFNEKVTRL